MAQIWSLNNVCQARNTCKRYREFTRSHEKFSFEEKVQHCFLAIFDKITEKIKI